MNADLPTAFPPGWIVPNWPVSAQVQAVFTTRSGGVSLPPFDSFNLGDHVQDDAEAVEANRQMLQQYCGAQPVFLQQVHGAQTVQLHTVAGQGHAAASPFAPLQQADACFTTASRLACTIMVADCLPVLLAHRSLPIVGAAHAGWRGLAGVEGRGVLESLVTAMQTALKDMAGVTNRHNGSSVDDEGWLAWLGPCIGPTAFEVGEEVRTAFMQHMPAVARAFVPGAQAGKWLANLPALARQRLIALGIDAVFGNDGSAAWCTWSNPQRFYSYRRHPHTGRMGAAIWLTSGQGAAAR